MRSTPSLATVRGISWTYPGDAEFFYIIWVYEVKTDYLGHVERYKACSDAKGCSQRQGVRYAEKFSQVIRIARRRLMLAINATMDLDLCLTDIDIMFCMPPLKHDVFIKQPMGFTDDHPKSAT
jgi:hypothetical protein